MQKESELGIGLARAIALETVYEVMEKGAYANLVLDKALSQSGVQLSDRKASSEIANGTIRMVKRLDWVLNFFLQKGIEKQNPWLRNVLRISAYQLLFMNKIPAYACVNDAVKMVRKKTKQAPLGGVVNAVLRNLLRNNVKITYPQDEIGFLSIYYSHPEWLVERFLKIYGRDNTIKILAYNNLAPRVVLRGNILKDTRKELIKLLQTEDISCSPGSNTPWSVVIESLNQPLSQLETYQKGFFYVQNEASMLAAPILNPQPGETVFDLCSGVGGKTTHLAEYMQNKGKIWAVDLYEKKIRLLNQNRERLGINIIDPTVGDILNIENEDPASGSKLVLLDVPCSGWGVLNRRSDLRWKKQPGDEAELTQLQSELLKAAANMVIPGGLLLYSTCTSNPEENEMIIHKFIQDNNFEPVGFAESIHFWNLDRDDVKNAAAGMLTIVPGKYLTDGMFYALMRRMN